MARFLPPIPQLSPSTRAMLRPFSTNTASSAIGQMTLPPLLLPVMTPRLVWLRAPITALPKPAVVHHYLVWNGKIGNTSPIPGFSTYQPSIAGYAPGMAPYRYPADAGFLLTPGNWVTFNLHYTPNGEATTDQ